jgi:hypothetical protein
MPDMGPELPCMPDMAVPAGVDVVAQPARPRDAARAAAIEMVRNFEVMEGSFKRWELVVVW